MARLSRELVVYSIKHHNLWPADDNELPEGMTRAECVALSLSFHGPAAHAMAISAKPPAALSQSAGSAGETLDKPSAATLARCERLGLGGGSASSMALSQSAGRELIGGVQSDHDEARVPTDADIKDAANRWAKALEIQRKFEKLLQGKTSDDPNYGEYRQAAEDATKRSGELEAQLRQMVNLADAKK